MDINQEQTIIQDEKQLLQLFTDIESRCLKIQNFEDPGLSLETMIEKLFLVQRSITNLQMFSPNETIKEVPIENMKYLVLPYHIGYLFGRINNPRRQSILQSKNYLTAYLQLIQMFNCQDEQIFPKNLYKTWKSISGTQNYKPTRDQLVQNMKDKKQIQLRYQNSIKIKEQSDQRQSIKDFITMQLYDSITALRTIQEELVILQYKDSIQNDKVSQEKHQEELNKPLPKMKIWQIKEPKEIVHECVCPDSINTNKKKELIAKVWQENPNKPTMTLEQVGQLEYQNMIEREARQKKQREQNKEDTDSQKQEVDARQKRKAREWDDWKDDHEKGAGNRNNR